MLLENKDSYEMRLKSFEVIVLFVIRARSQLLANDMHLKVRLHGLYLEVTLQAPLDNSPQTED